MALIGMDVTAASSDAKRLRQLAQELQTLIGATNSDVNGLASSWRGADAERFVHAQWPEHLAALKRAVSDIESLAATVLTNVEQQEQASAATGDGTSLRAQLETGIDGVTGIASLAGLGDDLLDDGSMLLDTPLPALFEHVSKVMPFIGAAFAGVGVANDLAHGDNTTAIIDTSFGVAIGVASVIALPLVPGLDALQGLLQVAAPTSGATQDANLNYVLQQRFGAGVTMSSATAEQSTWLSDRYSGPMGLPNAISDNMSAFASRTTTPMINDGLHAVQTLGDGLVATGNDISGGIAGGVNSAMHWISTL